MESEKLQQTPSEPTERPDIPVKLIRMNEIQATKTAWLWFPYIPYGKITIIQGDPGEGKTTLVLNLAAALSRGEHLENDVSCKPVTVIYQTAEDGLADTVKPRLASANAECSRILVIDETEKCISMTDERLETAIRASGAKFVILDPLQAYLGANVDMHRANEIRPIMSHLGNIAEKYGCAIVLIGHMNKASGMKASYRGLGSIDLAAAARSVLIVARDRDNPTIRVVIQTKSSLAPEGKGVQHMVRIRHTITEHFLRTTSKKTKPFRISATRCSRLKPHISSFSEKRLRNITKSKPDRAAVSPTT